MNIDNAMTTQTKTTWRKVKLGEMINPVLGGTPSRTEKDYWNGNIPWISIQDIINADGRYIRKTAETISQVGLDHSHATILPRGTIILSARGTVGAMAMLAEPMTFNQSCYGLVSKDPKSLDQMYLFYALAESMKKAKTMAHGGVFDTFTKDTFNYIDFEYPENTRAQKRIADILSSFDDKIELNNKISRTLEQMAQAIFKEWFVKKQKSNAKGQKLEEIALIIKGKKPRRIYDKSHGNDLEYLLIESFTTNNRFFTDDDGVPQSEEGDVIVVMDGASSGRIFRGRKGAVGSTLAVIKPKEEISREFLFLLLKYAELQLVDNLTGSAIPHLDKDFLKTYPVSVPVQEAMMQFTDMVRPMLQKMVEIEVENQKLAALRDLLLPKLMRGEVRI